MSTKSTTLSKKWERFMATSKLRVTTGLILCMVVAFLPLSAYIFGKSSSEKLKMNYIHEINVSTENVIIQTDSFIKDGEFLWNDALNEGYSQIQQQEVKENLTPTAVQKRQTDLKNKVAEQQKIFNEKLYGKKASDRTQYEILRFEDHDALSKIGVWTLWGSHLILFVVYVIWYWVMLGGGETFGIRAKRFRSKRYAFITSALMAAGVVTSYVLSGSVFHLLILAIVDVMVCIAFSFVAFCYGQPINKGIKV